MIAIPMGIVHVIWSFYLVCGRTAFRVDDLRSQCFGR